MSSRPLVLIVEDDPLILTSLEDLLTEEGFDLVSATGGREALEELDRDTERFCSVVTDVRLGAGPDGWEIGRHAREINGGMPIIYMTGDSAEQWAAHGVPNSILLQKPFVPSQLVVALTGLLNQKSSTLPPG